MAAPRINVVQAEVLIARSPTRLIKIGLSASERQSLMNPEDLGSRPPQVLPRLDCPTSSASTLVPQGAAFSRPE